MKKKEADRLREIANVLDDHSYDIYRENSKQARWFHWAANEIRVVLMEAGYNGIIDAKYSKPEGKWELNKEEKIWFLYKI